MRDVWWIRPTMLLFGACACAPASDPPADATTTTATESTGTTTASSATATEPDPSSTTETSSAADTSTTADGCGCSPNTPRALDDVLAAGFTAAEAIAAFDGAAIPFQWTGYAGQPNTTLRYTMTYRGGVLEEGPGGDDGCSFMSAPCPDGVVIEVDLHVTTDDGWLSWTAPALVEGRLDQNLVLGVMPQDIATNTGTLAEQPYEYMRIPAEIATIELDAGRNATPRPSMFATIIGWSPQVSGVVLGQNQ